ncbi:MAG: hypothetical protein ABI187_08355 [Ornithinibacter sp.]
MPDGGGTDQIEPYTSSTQRSGILVDMARRAFLVPHGPTALLSHCLRPCCPDALRTTHHASERAAAARHPAPGTRHPASGIRHPASPGSDGAFRGLSRPGHGEGPACRVAYGPFVMAAGVSRRQVTC